MRAAVSQSRIVYIQDNKFSTSNPPAGGPAIAFCMKYRDHGNIRLPTWTIGHRLHVQGWVYRLSGTASFNLLCWDTWDYLSSNLAKDTTAVGRWIRFDRISDAPLNATKPQPGVDFQLGQPYDNPTTSVWVGGVVVDIIP